MRRRERMMTEPLRVPCSAELMVRTPSTFDDWIDYFRAWQDALGLPGDLRTIEFQAKFGEQPVPHIEFGHYKGQRKWPTVMHIPHQPIRDTLLKLIVYQGDTEFASVEQQRNLLKLAPSDYDFLALKRVITEEMRHGWQMAYLLCTHFGDEGKGEAAKLLERRADKDERLLGSFNERVDTWLDFFTYTQFIDRDGKFQLKMLAVSAFDPLSRSMGPMLKEESFHLGAGHNGLLRIVKTGKMPLEVIQRFFYKWIPTAFDLFGSDNSSSAHRAYVWGLKGRYDERENPTEADTTHLNEYGRHLYRAEIVKLVERLNLWIPDRDRWLKVPDPKFNRKIGQWADQMFTVDGEPMTDRARYEAYLQTVLPQPEHYALVHAVQSEPGWIEEKKADGLLEIEPEHTMPAPSGRDAAS
jgi:benzoyl-CoA 2,3-dioxygenase component B